MKKYLPKIGLYDFVIILGNIRRAEQRSKIIEKINEMLSEENTINNKLIDFKPITVQKNIDLLKIYCPDCFDENVISHGQYKNQKRYLCKNCNNTFIYSATKYDDWRKVFLEFIRRKTSRTSTYYYRIKTFISMLKKQNIISIGSRIIIESDKWTLNFEVQSNNQ